MKTSQEIIETTERYGAHNYHPLPVVIARAGGVWVEDIEGKRYVDMLSSYSALNHGHRHPAILAAVQAQMERVTLTSRAFHNEELGPFCEELARLCGKEMVLPMNTGAEAVETAIKAARKWGYLKKGIKRHKAEIICCEGNFHGRTVTVVSFSTEPDYREDFGPFTPGFKIIPYGDAKALAKAVTKNTVAFLVEPIQGEAGINVPRKGYLAACARICRERDILLMADEIQTGLGRTGKLFACLHEDVTPDLYILGKALGGGVYPVSAVIGPAGVLGLFRPGEHGSTFGGNPLAAAIGRAAIRVLLDERLVERSDEMGAYFMERIGRIDSPHVKDVRGRGLLIGVELKKKAGGARRFAERLMQDGLLCKETHEHVIRFAPPLVITKEEIDWAMERIEKALKMK
ncbi:MAG: ornithine--oxo-acid transaminase [Deltaproteobacteria bacterium]|nr:ornithine--oxo-acid transaminase [Deltaproteobacteria bacterium]